MTRFFAASRLAMLAVIAVTGLAVATSADAATKRRQYGTYVATGSSGPNVSYQSGPHTRVYISKRSWLDGGTEVLPGDRKFTDYAFPSEYGYPSFGRENNNRPIDRQPLMTPTDLGGYPRAFPLPPIPY